jgi:Sulfotransferase family
MDPDIATPVNPEAIPGDREMLEVLYVSGAPRSGSTILGMILGQLDGCCDVGELWALWRPAFKNGDLCGCGEPVDECEFWSIVIQKALGPDFAESGPRLGRLHRRTMGTLRAPLVWAHLRGWRKRAAYDEYARALADHYRAIAAASGARVVVDSSKMAGDALVATMIPGVRVSVVHIVRDPRGVAWSWKKQRQQPGPRGRDLDRHGVIAAATRWLIYNAFAQLLLAPRLGKQFRTVRYEDLLTDPAGITADLSSWIGNDPGAIPVSGTPPRLFVSRATHPVWGNPVRTASGDVPLRLDDEWRVHMKPSERRAVALLTLPLLIRYGYLGRRRS